jgi:hypothetical protein
LTFFLQVFDLPPKMKIQNGLAEVGVTAHANTAMLVIRSPKRPDLPVGKSGPAGAAGDDEMLFCDQM